MLIMPLQSSARPPMMTILVLPSEDRPAVSAKGTVSPSEKPMMTSRMTASKPPMCVSVWGRSGTGVLDDMRFTILGRRRDGDERLLGEGGLNLPLRRGVASDDSDIVGWRVCEMMGGISDLGWRDEGEPEKRLRGGKLECVSCQFDEKGMRTGNIVVAFTLSCAFSNDSLTRMILAAVLNLWTVNNGVVTGERWSEVGVDAEPKRPHRVRVGFSPFPLPLTRYH